MCAGGGEEICDPPCDEPSYAGGALPGALYFCDILRVGGELVRVWEGATGGLDFFALL